jgi:hypothetical protein
VRRDYPALFREDDPSSWPDGVLVESIGGGLVRVARAFE